MSNNNITFILHKPQLSENIGACARAMKNFNFKKMIVVDPKPIYPNDKILATSVGAKDVINKSKKLKGKILTIGITNQRETTVLWDKITGKAIYNAIVWQDRRTANFCEKLRKRKRIAFWDARNKIVAREKQIK